MVKEGPRNVGLTRLTRLHYDQWDQSTFGTYQSDAVTYMQIRLHHRSSFSSFHNTRESYASYRSMFRRTPLKAVLEYSDYSYR
jgi:hypothetical protein